jgi:putative pre-16S rRNA nuclease
MNILSIDYGLSHLGFAIASTPLAEPIDQLSNASFDQIIKKIQFLIDQHKVEKIIVGVSEGAMAAKTQTFIESLKKHFSLSIIAYDETLSTLTAKKYLQESGASKTTRQEKDHQVAAAVILQSYLDDHPEELM